MTTGSATLPRMFWQWARERAARPMLRQKQLGIWQPTRWQQAAEAVGQVAAALAGLGVRPGDVVGILADLTSEELEVFSKAAERNPSHDEVHP